MRIRRGSNIDCKGKGRVLMIGMRHGWFLPLQALIRGIGIQIDHSGKGEQNRTDKPFGPPIYTHTHWLTRIG